MITIRQTLLFTLLFLFFVSHAQKKEPVLLLRQGPVKATPNITETAIQNFNAKAARHRDKAFAILQFESLPTAETRNFLAQQGIILLDYIPENAYTVSFTGKLNTGLLKKAGARAIVQPTPQQKMPPALAKGMVPDWARKENGKIDVWVAFPKTYTGSEVVRYLTEKKMEVRTTWHLQYGILEVRLAENRLAELAALPFIEYVEPVPGEDQPLNMNSRNGARANVLQAAVADGGKGLTGEGVVIGIGDEGNVNSHADVTGSRLINEIEMYSASFHATHVTTTAAGAGIVNELYKGFAPKVTVISQSFSGIIRNVEQYVQDYGMVLTNNSYATGGASCGYYGEYNLSSRLLDQQAFELPHLQHVFAAGNDGQQSCNAYPLGFHTAFGAYQAAKNVITVGAHNADGASRHTSSKGPVADGRIKPEITAQGGAVTSGSPNNGYAGNSGTSMAAPAVTGGLALLYQRYRQLHGTNPQNGLIKTLLCGGGADAGNAGPDYTYGYGRMHLLRSVEMLEKSYYRVGSLTNGGEQQYTIVVPAGTAQLKVTLYWNDPAASMLTSKTLVNDLDLTVADQALVTHLPQVLDPSPTGVQKVATTGADHVNNLEQVMINNPAPGSYTINISGVVAQNPAQDYFVVYDILPVSTTLTNPTGGMGVAPGQTVTINWDSYGEPANTFTLKYSTDNGATWLNISTTVSATTRQHNWTVPNVPTNQALVRIERNGTAISHTTLPFTIIGVPTLSLAPVQCEGYMAIQWTAVTGATGYEVLMKQDNEMVSIATTTATEYTLSGLSKDSVYWVSVRALVGDKPGRRAAAISRQPATGTCTGTISDNDLALEAIVGPGNGRKHTSIELSGTNQVTIRVKNLDDQPVTGFTVKYKRESNAWVEEVLPDVTLPAGATYTHTFTASEDLSAVGDYTFVAVVENHTTDPVPLNDTAVTIVRHLNNLPLDLTTPFLDDLESAVKATYTKDAIGLAGIDRFDYTDLSLKGRLNTFSMIPFSGTKSLWLLANGAVSTPAGVEAVTGTYNLSGYDANSHDIRLHFKARHSILPDAQNKLWVRGRDDQPWIELLNLNQYATASFSNIELADSLLKYGQNFSTSFQLKWDQAPGTGSLILDDIMLQEVFDDLQLLIIDTVLNQSCGSEPLQITLRNSSNKVLNHVPARFRVNDGEWITEIIPSINPNTTLSYTFSTPLGFPAPGSYTVKVLVDFPTDNIRVNDTLITAVNYASIVKTFPYFQNFESGEGGWYSRGDNSSWTYGTPATPAITKAASGTKAWTTTLSPIADYYESSELYSPCFEIGGMQNPTLSFSIATDLHGVQDTIYDLVWVDYSTDNQNWYQLIDTTAAGTNWYIPDDLSAWGTRKTRWHVVTMGLPKNVGVVRLRINRFKHPDAPTEGIAIDDIHIYDSSRKIYDAVSPSVTVTKTVSGNDWVDFESEGQLVASIHPNGQHLGQTAVQAFIHSGPVRHNKQQYYHHRNLTIKPEVTAVSEPVTVRMYFLDSENEALINATGCTSCTKPMSAYDLGVSKYSDPSAEKENGTTADNMGATWSFIPPGQVTIVPFQKGYYAEFKVNDFSEFWLSNGGLDGLTPLPVRLLDFSAQKVLGANVLLNWSTAQEVNVSHFEVEVAKSEADLRAGRFTRIGEVMAAGTSTTTQHYFYTDTEPGKIATRYYRLKMVDEDRSFTYSSIRPIIFNNAADWQVYPNPSTGAFTLGYQLKSTERMDAFIYDRNGRMIKQYHQRGTGEVQRLTIDLTPTTFAPGIYMLQAMVNGRKEYFKLYKF